MNAISDAAALRPAGRDAVTWYCYLVLGYYTFLVAIQGNILPFLQSELGLTWREVSLHTSAIAVGTIVIGSFGERVVARFGRRTMLLFAIFGTALGVGLLALSPVTAASIASCLVIGLLGAFIPVVVPAALSDIYGPRRDVAFTESNAVAYGFAVMAPVLTGLFVWLGLDWRFTLLTAILTGLSLAAIYGRLPIPHLAKPTGKASQALPPAYWFYWATLGLCVAVEFSVLLWAPAYLERVLGLDATSAAIGAAAFFVAMFVGRTIGSGLVRFVPTRRLFIGEAATTIAGFALYWGSADPGFAIAGLFVVGLGIALLFPLVLGFAIGAAPEAADKAAARVMLAPGIAILFTPPLLGAIADGAGLAVAQLMLPVFMALAVLTFLGGELALRRSR